jgi:hypothetical protein
MGRHRAVTVNKWRWPPSLHHSPWPSIYLLRIAWPTCQFWSLMHGRPHQTQKLQSVCGTQNRNRFTKTTQWLLDQKLWAVRTVQTKIGHEKHTQMEFKCKAEVKLCNATGRVLWVGMLTLWRWFWLRLRWKCLENSENSHEWPTIGKRGMGQWVLLESCRHFSLRSELVSSLRCSNPSKFGSNPRVCWIKTGCVDFSLFLLCDTIIRRKIYFIYI